MGRKSSKEPLLNLALDRITEIKLASNVAYIGNDDFDADNYFKDVLGVTVSGEGPQRVHLAIDRTNAPYVITKPLHHTQKIRVEVVGGDRDYN